MSKKYIAIIVVTVLALGSFTTFYNYLSTVTDRFTVNQTDVKRIDTSDGTTRDQYQIFATRVSDGRTMVFRNEDATFWFFGCCKWDSADVQAVASSAAKDGFEVDISYYGWRSQWFSWFWNAVAVEKVG